jgi:hypothetical protein
MTLVEKRSKRTQMVAYALIGVMLAAMGYGVGVWSAPVTSFGIDGSGNLGVNRINTNTVQLAGVDVTKAITEETASYVVWVDGATYYAKSGSTGAVTSNANAATLINGLITNGVSIFIKSGVYSINTKLLITDKYSVTITGSGSSYNPSGTYFNWTNVNPGILLEIYASQDVTINGIGFNDAAETSTAILVNGDNTPIDKKIYIENISITGFLVGIKLYQTGDVTDYQIANFVLNKFRIDECPTAIEINTSNYDGGEISNGIIYSGVNQIKINRSGNTRITNVEGGGAGVNSFIYLNGVTNGLTVDGCSSEAATYLLYAAAAGNGPTINIRNSILDSQLYFNNNAVTQIGINDSSIIALINSNTDNLFTLNNCQLAATSEIRLTSYNSMGSSTGCIYKNGAIINLNGAVTFWKSYSDHGNINVTGIGSFFNIKSYINYVTEKSGTATLLNGQNHVHVTHGLSYTPTAGDISITFTEIPTNASTGWRVGNITSAEYIFFENDPGASNLDFSWSAHKTP